MNRIDDLFGEPIRRDHEALGPGAALLHGFALTEARAVLDAVDVITTAAPLRHLITPGGFRMSVAITNCGRLGWISDHRGYRYSALDPETGQPWPAMPDALLTLAQSAAVEAGYAHFTPDACLINRYVPGARMTLHQDRNEKDFSHPIVSVSLGLPVVFQLEVAHLPVALPQLRHRTLHESLTTLAAAMVATAKAATKQRSMLFKTT